MVSNMLIGDFCHQDFTVWNEELHPRFSFTLHVTEMELSIMELYICICMYIHTRTHV